MRIYHLRDLPPIDKRVMHSLGKTLLATPFILGWGYGIWWMYQQDKFPIFILIIQLIFFPLFAMLLFKDIISRFKKHRFLLATAGSELLIPLNFAIKKAKEENELYLALETDDFNKLVVANVTKKERRLARKNTVTYVTFKRFEFSCDINLDILAQALKQVKNDTGFQGSPVSIEENQIFYQFDSNWYKTATLKSFLQKRFPVQFNGKIVKRVISHL
jgi:hypothetical protein